MNRNSVIILFFIYCHSLKAQNYTSNFLYNGCSYSYNSFLSSDTIKCRETEYKLLFEDLFDSIALNTSKWSTSYPWGRALHSSESGTGWEHAYFLDENVSVGNGFLHLQIKADPAIRPSPDDPNQSVSFKYSSGMLFSKRNFIRGKFEIRCKIPAIEGLWPAFWMYGFCAQELDVFEFTNPSESYDPDVDSRSMIMTYHRQYDCTDTSMGSCHHGFTRIVGENLSLDFHTYSLEWDDYKIIWRLDNEIVRQVYRLWVVSPKYPDGPINGYSYPVKECSELKPNTRYTEFPAFPLDANPMHVIVGSGVKLKKNVVVPKEFLVDYIRVYEEKDIGPKLLSNNLSDFDLFPNPTSGIINIPSRILGKKIEKIELFNAWGQICNFEYNITNDMIIIDLQILPKGIYFIKVIVDDFTKVKKIIYN